MSRTAIQVVALDKLGAEIAHMIWVTDHDCARARALMWLQHDAEVNRIIGYSLERDQSGDPVQATLFDERVPF